MSRAVSFASVAKAVLPSIVNITTKVVREVEGNDVFPFLFQSPRQVVTAALGSGLLITECGLVITNDHVIDKAEKIRVVTYDDHTYEAEVLIRDFMHDLAVLRIIIEGSKDEALMMDEDDDSMDDDAYDSDDLIRGNDDDDDYFVSSKKKQKELSKKKRSKNKNNKNNKKKKGSKSLFIPMKIGKAEESEVGDAVLAVGNNLGFRGTVTDGIISAIGRTDDERLPLTYPQFPLIQTNASINPGSSGGALVNMQGELIGINESIASSTGGNQGIGFAVPSNFVAPLLRAALNGSLEADRVWDGIGVSNCPMVLDNNSINGNKDEPRGIRVISVHPESPAKQAGLKRGDVITMINETGMRSTNVFHMLIAGSIPDCSLDYQVWRPKKSWLKKLKKERKVDRLVVSALPFAVESKEESHKSMSVKVKIESIPAPKSKPLEITDRGNPLFGATVCELCPAVNADFGLDYTQRGIVVWELNHGSQAHKLGFHIGDIILSIDDRRVRTLSDIEKMAEDLEYRKNCRIWYKRRGKRQHIDVYLRSAGARARRRYARL